MCFQATFVFLIVQQTNLTLGDYVYPDWAMVIAWLVALFPISLIVSVGLLQYCTLGGYQVIKRAVIS